jgi:drug/metabolite transporter (DMT)-like permease
VRSLPLAEIAVLVMTMAWGLSFVVIRDALESCGAYTLTALRMVVGFGAAVLLLRPRLRGTTALEWRSGALGGLILATGYILQTVGLRTAGAGAGGFLTAFYVSLVPVIDAAVFRRRPGLRDIVGLAVATVGISMIVVDPERLTLSAGESLIAVSAFCWAGQIVLVGRVAERVDAARFATVQLGTIAVAACAALPFAGERPVEWSGSLVAAVFFLGYVACALGFAVQAWAQRKFSPARIAILFAAEPVFAAFFGWGLQDEQFGWLEITGALVVLVAVGIALAPVRRRPEEAGALASDA